MKIFDISRQTGRHPQRPGPVEGLPAITTEKNAKAGENIPVTQGFRRKESGLECTLPDKLRASPRQPGPMKPSFFAEIDENNTPAAVSSIDPPPRNVPFASFCTTYPASAPARDPRVKSAPVEKNNTPPPGLQPHESIPGSKLARKLRAPGRRFHLPLDVTRAICHINEWLPV
jgi:hypothetical protein